MNNLSRLIITSLIIGSISFGLVNAKIDPSYKDNSNYQEYIDFFEDVFQMMSDNYYTEISRNKYEAFVSAWSDSIYQKLVAEGKSNNYIRWRSAAYLVEKLRMEHDKFSGFIPPPAVEKFEQEMYGKRIDLGITGKRIDVGFEIEHVEPRSSAYKAGLRNRDLIVRIDGKDLMQATKKEIDDLLNPFEDAEVSISYVDSANLKPHYIEITAEEYFKQTVFMCDGHYPGVACLEVQKFNRKTGEDMFRHMDLILKQPTVGLILDFRGNPGGPPLAAREISSFFLKPGSDLAYFEGRNMKKAVLDVPVIPENLRYTEPIVLLVDENSGSATELFSGALQDRQRALIMGQKTAGSVLLKGIYYFDDGSALGLMKAQGYFPNGKPYDLRGIYPNEYIEVGEKESVQQKAGQYLFGTYIKERQKKLN